mmetsp:Transcript_42714/g.48544  ORF Transcript_42714/g.48544 Transcript_42714/m.48544 type:complete len:417 (+) Transcript_42714:67-1317(+)|eukprot:CAMPEP_0194172456 /NCGR_PEP_ID=MMETSP0154-20130528/6932_1 /TAXON_ID=1049557 /ORGANISM="Thalassiothrix antarctica, Strain L6-D1" /LENGTH=416 /DNA_ID=CAMNT_0038885147 /DNA_START=28 /DNA_END=1278 /DNA_ORIENTATION=-
MANYLENEFEKHPSEHLDPSCPPLDLVWMFTLEEKRKLDRSSHFINKEDIPRRSIVEDNRIIDYLRSQGFTIGLARTLIANTDAFAARIWLINNSKSMNCADGHRVVQDARHKITNVSCTRWEEVSSTLFWHANFAALMKAPSAIRMVHGAMGHPQQLGVASSEEVDIQSEIRRLSSLMQQTPAGSGCEMLPHLREIVDSCLKIPVELFGEDRFMAIIFVTDRLPIDENGSEGEHVTKEFLETLNMLSGLPIWVVIRLSTDDQHIVDFYNKLDDQMAYVKVESGQVHLDVLDDFVSEAEAVNNHNPWLNYAYPLHLCRESAVNFPVFDVLNDRPLSHDELVDFINLLFYRNPAGVWAAQPLPNPLTHYAQFRAEVLELVKKGGSLYNPIKRRVQPWIDMRLMDKIYGPPKKSCVIL